MAMNGSWISVNVVIVVVIIVVVVVAVVAVAVAVAVILSIKGDFLRGCLRLWKRLSFCHRSRFFESLSRSLLLRRRPAAA